METLPSNSTPTYPKQDEKHMNFLPKPPKNNPWIQLSSPTSGSSIKESPRDETNLPRICPPIIPSASNTLLEGV